MVVTCLQVKLLICLFVACVLTVTLSFVVYHYYPFDARKIDNKNKTKLVNETKAIGESITLPNEICLPRPTLVTLHDHHLYYPNIVSLYRCGGACGEHKPTVRSCEVNSSSSIPLHVFNRLKSRNETFLMTNHTSCYCKCKFQSSVCATAQDWNDESCRCTCTESEGFSKCSLNQMWNPNLCRCECDVTCSHSRKNLNEDTCTCDCLPKFYKRCTRKNKVLRYSDCKCVRPPGVKMDLSRNPLCEDISTKWMLIIIGTGLFTVFVAVMDTFLYCKSAGNTLKCCSTAENVKFKTETQKST